MFNKWAFTLLELITVLAIIWILSSAVSLWLNSFWSTTELYNTKDIINSKIKSEKIWIISWEINCSQINLYNKKEYFTILNSEKNWTNCKKEYFWDNIIVDTWNIFIENNNLSNEIEVLKTWDVFQKIQYGKVQKIIWDTSKAFISFPISNSRSYKIISKAVNWKIEEVEIIFYNLKRKDLEIYDPKIITIDEMQWENFRKDKIFINNLNVVFQSPKPESKMYTNNQRVNNLRIKLINWNEDVSFFNIFSY